MLITPRRKKTILTILLLLFVYASSVGQTAGSGITAENSSTYIMLGFLQFLITTVIMMIVPFIWRLINGIEFSDIMRHTGTTDIDGRIIHHHLRKKRYGFI